LEVGLFRWMRLKQGRLTFVYLEVGDGIYRLRTGTNYLAG
jgi:hypothetical protein